MITFKGYPRADGAVGIRNHVVITSTVACSNGVVARVSKKYPDLVSMSSIGGCGNCHGSPQFVHTVENICKHPNVYATILIGLGCEDVDAQVLADKLIKEGYRVFCRRIQLDGGSDKVFEDAERAAKELLKEAAEVEPVDCPISKLSVGFRFAHEDAYTNCIVNPAFGNVADWLIEEGGTAVVSQTPSFMGGEKELINRAVNKNVADKLNELYVNQRFQIKDFYGECNADKLSLEDEALGFSTPAERAVAHFSMAGHASINHVIADDQRLETRDGLVFQDGTALEAEGVSNILAAGCQLAFLVSSRVSFTGWAAAPLCKVVTKKETFSLSPGDIDICAERKDGKLKSLPELAAEIEKTILEIANGKKTSAEARHHDGGIFETHYRLAPELRKVETPILDFC